jgi:hypothetical protein
MEMDRSKSRLAPLAVGSNTLSCTALSTILPTTKRAAEQGQMQLIQYPEVEVGGVSIPFREAGATVAQALSLLDGCPTSADIFRNQPRRRRAAITTEGPIAPSFTMSFLMTKT